MPYVTVWRYPERGRKKMRQVPRVSGSHTSRGEGSTLVSTHMLSQLRSKYAFLPLPNRLSLFVRRLSPQIVVTNIGPECHLLVALRPVFPAEGAGRFQGN